jgi:hypothetical protein
VVATHLKKKIFFFIISRSLPIETNIWNGHKNKGEVSKNEGGISKIKGKCQKMKGEYQKMCVSPRLD